MIQENRNKNKIIELRKTGISYGSLAKMFKLSRSRIHQICSNYKSPSSNISISRIHKGILARDNFECQWKEFCKDKKTNIKDLIVHHIDFNDNNNNSENLLTLCRSCHSKFHAKNHISKIIEKNLTVNFMKRYGKGYKKCLNCGIENIKKSKNSLIFCSLKCKIEHNNKKWTRICHKCKKEFILNSI